MSLVNCSMRTGCFPNAWKESVVTPLEKVKGSIRCEDFRPINALPTYEKLLEKIIHTQLEEYFDDNNLLMEYQSGFRKKHSCESALNQIIVCWKEEMAAKNKVISVFLDLARAFETIDRGILIQKLERYGVKDVELEWFKSYLVDRTQRTRVSGSISESIRTSLGVPQGSILGPLLFIIYINDMDKVLHHSKLALFANDALIFVAGADVKECEKLMQEDLEKLNKWLKQNKLKLNIKKTKAMVFNDECNINLSLDGESVEQVRSIKYLGVMLDFRLKFGLHLDYLVKKISKKVGYFKRIRKRVDVCMAIKIYNVMVKPHFEYCSTILYLCCDTMLAKLQRLQNKAMRVILLGNRYTRISYMLETLMWLNVKQRLCMNVLIFIFKIKELNLPNYLSRYVNYVRDVQPYVLRNLNDFRLPTYRTQFAQNSLIYKGFGLFNSLPVEIKNEHNFRNFKRGVIEFVKNEI